MVWRVTAASALLIASACGLISAEDKDPVREKLFAAKVAYDAEMGKYRKAAEDWFAKREEAARKVGDKKAMDQTKTERKAFDESGDLPKTVPAAIPQKQAAAKKSLEAAYALAVKEYTKAKKDTEAAAVEAEWMNIPGGKASGIDLLALVDPKTHAVRGEWKKDGAALVCDSGDKHVTLQLAYEPGEEYDLEVTCRHVAGKDSNIAVGLVAGDRQVRAVFDGWPGDGPFTGLDKVDGKDALNNVTAVKGELLKDGKDHKIICAVRSGRIDVSVDGKAVIAFKGEFTRFEVADTRFVPNKKALFLAAAPKTTMRFDHIVVKPVKGKGNVIP